MNATTRPEEIGPVDIVVIATKAMHVRDAAISAHSLIGPHTIVLPIQNGLGSGEVVAEVLGEAYVASAWPAVRRVARAPGHVHHHGFELCASAAPRPGVGTIERVADVWRDAGFRVDTDDDIDRLVWEKLICNVCFSGTCTILGLTIGEVMAEPGAMVRCHRVRRRGI